MCCCASRRVFIAAPCRPCASPNSSANACFCEGRSQKSTNRHPATPASLNSNTPPTNWNFDMLDFPRTALREGGDPGSREGSLDSRLRGNERNASFAGALRLSLVRADIALGLVDQILGRCGRGCDDSLHVLAAQGLDGEITLF